MTPKEKAKELVKKFICIDIKLEADNIDYEMLECELGYNPKEFALVAVDEIIHQWQIIDIYLADGNGELNTNLRYWYEVKQEIEKL